MERTLSQTEAKVVLDLEWRNKKTITLAELRHALGASESYARKLAHGLVKKGWFERLRPGLFQLVPADRGREGVPDTNPLAAGAVLVSPYFYSFGTACTHHGLTEQVFSEVYLVCQEHRRPETIRDKRYVFVYVPEEQFFGFEEVAVFGHAVQMATTERAVLDAIDRPRYAGGIGEVSRIIARAASKVSWDVLIALARKWGLVGIGSAPGLLRRPAQSQRARPSAGDVTRARTPEEQDPARLAPQVGHVRQACSSVERRGERPPGCAHLEGRESASARGLPEEGARPVIEDKFVDLYARNSGLRDKLVAERDIVLTYALRALLDASVMDPWLSRVARAYAS